MLPTNPIPVFGVINGLQPGSLDHARIQSFAAGQLNFSQVPRNKVLIITILVVESNNLGTTGMYFLNVGPGDEARNAYPDQSSIALRGDRKSIQQIRESSGLLFIVESGKFLKAVNEKISAFAVDLKFRGFLVDDLNYSS